MNTLVMKSIFGSALYGTSTPQSDMDYKGIFIPDAKSIIMGNTIDHYQENTNNSNSKNTADDVDCEMYSLKYFLQLAIKGETIALDMMHTPSEMIVDYDYMAPWDFIYQNRSKFYTTDMKSYLGYVKKQASKYGIKGTRMAALRQVKDAITGLESVYYVSPEQALREQGTLVGHINCKRHVKLKDVINVLPKNSYCCLFKCPKTGNMFYEIMGSKHQLTITLEEFKQKVFSEWEKYGERARLAELNQGIDWKSLHHAVRGGLQLKEIYSTGDLKYPLRDKDLLLDIKNGNMTFKDVSGILEDLINDVENLSISASKNGMPEKVDTSFWDKFLYDVYSDHIKQHWSMK